MLAGELIGGLCQARDAVRLRRLEERRRGQVGDGLALVPARGAAQADPAGAVDGVVPARRLHELALAVDADMKPRTHARLHAEQPAECAMTDEHGALSAAGKMR